MLKRRSTKQIKKSPTDYVSGKEGHHQNGGTDSGNKSGNDNTQSGKLTKTVDGAKMPKTASDYPLYMMLGLGLMVVGAVVFRRVLREKKAA